MDDEDPAAKFLAAVGLKAGKGGYGPYSIGKGYTDNYWRKDPHDTSTSGGVRK